MTAVKEDVVSEAVPALSEAVPITDEPFLKVMVSPLGGAPEVELTVAVKVTTWPTTEGLSEETSVVVVEAMIACLRVEEVLLVLLPSPLYFAEME